MRKSCADLISIQVIHIPTVRWGIVIVTLAAFVWVETLAYAVAQSVRVSHSTDIGKLVKNLDGKILGKIKDLVINWRTDGYIEYAVVASGGFLGLGDEYFAVPWEALTLSDSKEQFVLNMKEEQLKDILGFVMKGDMGFGDMGSDVNVSVARSLDRQ